MVKSKLQEMLDAQTELEVMLGRIENAAYLARVRVGMEAYKQDVADHIEHIQVVIAAIPDQVTKLERLRQTFMEMEDE